MSQIDNRAFEEQLRVAALGDRDVLFPLLLEVQSELGRFVADRHGSALQSRVSVEDILQETFIRAFKEAKSLKANNRTSFLAWLKTIATNQINDAARRQNAIKRGGDRVRVEGSQDRFADRVVDLLEELSEVGGNTPSQFAARHEAVDAMNLALANLPDEQREAVRLHFFERLTLRETALQMDRTWDSVRGLIQRAKKTLRESLHKSSMWLSKKR